MTTDDMLTAMAPIFRDVFDDDHLTPTKDMVAADVPGWDSLGQIRLVVAVESHFGVTFTSAEIGGWPNVGAFAEAVARKLP